MVQKEYDFMNMYFICTLERTDIVQNFINVE